MTPGPGNGPAPAVTSGAWARHVAGVGVVAALIASCGGNGDPDSEAGDRSTASEQSGLGFASTDEIAGRDAVLVVDGETRATEFVRASDAAARPAVEESAALPGEGSLINVTGVQVGPERWVVAGNDCDSVEVVDPAGCTPGTLTLAVLDGDTWVEVDGLPAEFTNAFVSVHGASNGRVLLGRWDRGASRYWLLDVEARSVERVAWTPEPLDIGEGLVTDANVDAGGQTRTACLVDDRLVVIESRDGAELEAQITVVDVDDPAAPLVVAGAPQPLAEATAQISPVCEDGQVPYLIATGAGGGPLAYEISLSETTFGPAIASDPGGGPISAITYGPGTVAIQQSGTGATGGPDDTVPAGSDIPSEGDGGSGPGPANHVVLFRDGRWRRLDPQVAMTSDEVVQPLGDPELPLIVSSRGRGAGYRLVEAA